VIRPTGPERSQFDYRRAPWKRDLITEELAMAALTEVHRSWLTDLASLVGAQVPASGPSGPAASSTAAPAGGNDSAPDARAAAAKLRARIEEERKRAAAEWKQLQAAQLNLQERLAAAQGEEKSKLEALQKQLEPKAADAKKTFDRAVADLEAIDSPATKQEQLVALLARRGAKGSAAEHVEVDVKGLDPNKRSLNKDATTTISSYDNGKGVIDKVHDQRHVGVDGVSQSHAETHETHSEAGVRRVGSETNTHVSTDGHVSHTEKSSDEFETADGRKAKIEHAKSVEASSHGVSQSKTTTTTHLDGSGTATTANIGAERGDGRAGLAFGGSRTDTDAAEHATTGSGKGSAGMIAGKDGLGAYGGGEGGVKTKNGNGFNTGAVAGLNANIVCRIGDPTGTPPRYPLYIKVNLGASLTLSAGKAKEGSDRSFSVTAKGSETVYLEEKRMLSEHEAADYVTALKVASDGGTVPATYKELTIVCAGVKQGWAVAQQMWKAGGKPLSKEMVDALTHAGDSTEVGGSTTGEIGVSAQAKGIGFQASESDTRDHSTRATRNDKGTLDIDAKAGHTQESARNASVAPGPIGMTGGTKHTVRTTLGFTIVIDPKDDPDGKVIAALGQCSKDADYESFVVTYKAKITVIDRTDGKATSDSTTAGLTVGGKKVMEIGTHQGIATSRTVDGQGHEKHRETVGTAGAGGTIGSLGDSQSDEASARSDDQGNSSLDLAQTKDGTDYGNAARQLAGKMPLVGRLVGAGKKKPVAGALTAAAGGAEEDDSKTQDVAGIKLTTKDLKRIGQIACTDRSRWNGAPHRYQENKDWAKAGDAIVASNGAPDVVAEQLAQFVGGDRIERMNMVLLFIRGGNNIDMGTGFEFPDSLKDKRADYKRLIEDPFEPTLAAIAQAAPQMAAAQAHMLSTQIEPLYQAFYGCHDFANPSYKAEMLAAIVKRKNALEDAARQYGGPGSAEDDKKAAADRIKRTRDSFLDYASSEHDLFQKLEDLKGGYEDFVTRDHDEISSCLRQLDAVHARWNRDFDAAVKQAPPGTYDQDIFRPNKAELDRWKKLASRKGIGV